MRRVLPLKKVNVCDIRPEARERYIGRFPDRDFEMVSCADTEAACRESDVICSGVNTYDGKLTCRNVALAHGYEYTDLKTLI